MENPSIFGTQYVFCLEKYRIIGTQYVSDQKKTSTNDAGFFHPGKK